MRAIQLIAHGAPGVFKEGQLPDPVPARDEAVVRVDACGLNHLDLWLEAGALPIPVKLPRIPGCEISGTVSAVGEAVTTWKVGDRVAVQSNIFCGQCERCQAGEETLCLETQLLGVERDGGFAEMVVVPARVLVALPPNVDFQTAAALGLAASTAMHMLTQRVEVKPGDWVLVMGASSGVGSAAIQIAVQLGARVITTASSAGKAELGRKLGAQQVIDLRQADWWDAVRDITAKQGVKVIIEHIGGKVLEQAFRCLARGGTIVTCGATAGREVQLALWPFFVKEQRLIGSYSRNRADIVRTFDWAAQGKIQPVINRVYGLADVPSAFAALRDRTVMGKLVVRPGQ